jgi:hypothetical protein
MRLPRWQFTMRQMMAAVAIAAVASWLASIRYGPSGNIVFGIIAPLVVMIPILIICISGGMRPGVVRG